jgi:hypothetical protein
MAELDQEWYQRCDDRIAMGAEQYGPENFLKVDLVEFIIEELVDLANYAQMLFIRVRLLQEHAYERGLNLSLGFAESIQQQDELPPNPSAFVGQQEVFGLLSRDEI